MYLAALTSAATLLNGKTQNGAAGANAASTHDNSPKRSLGVVRREVERSLARQLVWRRAGRQPKLVVVASSRSGGPTIQAVQLHPLAQQFASVADAYERGRPEYAPAVIGAIAAELGIGPGHRVLDLAAGTGKLTRALVAYGFAVTAVEPLEPLRVLLRNKVPGAIMRAGVAEAIPLEDRSVAAVTIADAFHWFDRPRALSEIRRVLARGGGVALLNTVPDWGGASWAHELGTLVTGARPEHPNFDGRPWQEFVREADGFADPWELQVTTYAPADPERVLTHMSSISWIAGLPEPERADLLARIRAVIRAGDTPKRFALHVEVGLTTLVE